MTQLPAKVYPQFIEAFDKKVKEYQDSIQRMNENQDLYVVVKEAADEHKDFLARFSEVKIKLYDSGISFYVYVGDAEITPEEVRALCFSIGKELVRKKLHHDGEPSHYSTDNMEYTWYTSRKDGRTVNICLKLHFGHSPIPTKWLDVERETHYYTSHTYKLRWRDRPRISSEYTSPPYSCPLEDELKDEIPF